jgi:hypothetical protein
MKSPAKKRRAPFKYAREAECASERSRSARKYARGGRRFAKLLKFAKLDAKLLEHNFSCFAKNRWMLRAFSSWNILRNATVAFSLLFGN